MATKPEKSAGNAKRPDSKKKKPAFSAQEAREQKKQAKRKGLRPGARNSVEAQDQKGQSAKDKDARVGSRKPIALVAEAPVKAAKAPRPVAAKPEPVVTQEQQLAKWERELDQERLTAELKNPSPDDAAGDLHPVHEAA